VFAFLRDLFASVILGTWAYFKDQRRITMSEFKQIAWAGIAMYLSNICYTIGVKMSNPVIGAAWQCACPICTAAMAIALKTEKATSRKMWGIGWAFAGSVFIVFFGQEVSLSSTEFVGNIFFFFNVLGYSAYCIMSKPLVKAGLPPITITAWAMLVVTAMLGVTVYIGENSPFLHSMLCDGCEDIWSLETDEILALAYFVLVFSVFLYVCIAWANQHVSSSIVSSYTVFQVRRRLEGTFDLSLRTTRWRKAVSD
jgi:drug/metabolite transporter (DMT)-like permease